MSRSPTPSAHPTIVAPSGRGGGSAFRHAAPEPGPDLVARPRLVDVLRGRFDRRLTVVTAGAGFGKTTLMAQAVAENRVEGNGTDVWLQIVPGDADSGHLLAGLGTSMADGDGVGPVSVAELVDRVWAQAPEHIALMLDDTHLIEAGSSAWETLATLLEQLPANGHLVLAGRTPVPLPMGRLLASDAAVVLAEDALAFTEDELARFAVQRSLPAELIAELPPWPALAVLVTAAGQGLSSGYLWEEVLSSLPDDRCQLLALAAEFEIIDDLVVGALTPGTDWTAAGLVDGLPLVDTDGAGAYRLHALWNGALDGLVERARRREALAAGAEALLAAGQHRRAAAAWAAAEDFDGLHRTIRDFAVLPITSVSVPDVMALLELLPTALRTAPIGAFLDAARHWATSARQAAVLFEKTIALAEATGDAEIESIAWWRLVQLLYLDDPGALEVHPRMEELAAQGVPLAASTPAFVRSVQAQREGRVTEALAQIDHFDAFDPDQRLAAESWRLMDLARPEAVPGSLETVLGPESIDLVGAQAVWLRGEVDPESAWLIAAQFPDIAGRKGVAHEQVSIRAVVATVALAAGDFVGAARVLDTTRGPMEFVGVQVRQLVAVADALLALCTEGDRAAHDLLAASLDEVPLDRWPARAHLHGLAMLRALVPGTEALDHCDLGPSLAVAVAAGRAVTALRTRGDTREAQALPWTRPDLLRVHVPLPLLAELAVGAHEDEAARNLLDRLPHRVTWLRRIADQHRGAVRSRAVESLSVLPQRPPYDLSVQALGTLALDRSDGRAVPEGWSKRERVRQLLALLLVHRKMSRSRLAAELWPDLAPGKALANLRVNLRHLQAALQPDRPAEHAPWFLRNEDDSLVLVPEGLSVDVDRFDERVAAAVRAEGHGSPSVALAEYEGASELYGGDLLPGIDHPVVDLERLRLRSMAQAAACRRGELVLARGEPEAAMAVAASAQRLDPLSERAHRLFIRCHLALGSTSTARQAGGYVQELLAAQGLVPEDETVRLLRRLQVPALHEKG